MHTKTPFVHITCLLRHWWVLIQSPAETFTVHWPCPICCYYTADEGQATVFSLLSTPCNSEVFCESGCDPLSLCFLQATIQFFNTTVWRLQGVFLLKEIRLHMLTPSCESNVLENSEALGSTEGAGTAFSQKKLHLHCVKRIILVGIHRGNTKYFLETMIVTYKVISKEQ